MAIGIFAKELLGTITEVPVDAKLAEQHGITATPAKFSLENGAVVTDHIILNPQTIEIPYELNNQDISLGGLNSSYGIRSATLYNILRNNLRTRDLYTVVTHHVLYENMALVDASADHTSPKTGTLRGTAKFMQVNRPSIQNVDFLKDQLSKDGTQFKAASATPLGTQILKEVNLVPNFLAETL